MGTPQEVKTKLLSRLKALRLPGFREGFEELARKAVEEDLSYEQYLLELTYRECDERSARKIERLLRDSRLPLEKTLGVFDQKRLSTKAARQVRSLLDGSFLDRRENVLAFGNSGAGKTHGNDRAKRTHLRGERSRKTDPP